MHLSQSWKVVASPVEWGIKSSRVFISNPWMVFVVTRPKRTWLWLHLWSLGSRAKQYERTPTQTNSKSLRSLRIYEALVELSRLANHEWLGFWLGPHVAHVHPLCILDIVFSPCRTSTYPNWHITYVVTLCSRSTKCVANVPPKFYWRWGCCLDMRPQKSLWMTARDHPSFLWMLLE